MFENGSVCGVYNTLNVTNDVITAQLMYSDSERLVYTYVIPIILTFGVSSNASFLYVVARIKRLRTITNYYLVTIATADIIFISISIGAYMWTFFSSPYVKSAPWDHDTGCVIAFSVPLAMYFTSMALITLVTLERYYAICYPLRNKMMASKRRTVKVIIATILISAVLGTLVSLKDIKILFTCLIWPDDDDQFVNFPNVIKYCSSIDPVKPITIMSEVLQTIPFFVAMFWNAYMYVRILHTLNKRDTKTMNTKNTIQVRNQVARLLIINGIAFFLCHVSYRLVAIHNILRLTMGIGLLKTDHAVGLLVIISRGGLYLNSSINPIIYNLSSSFYYEGFKEAFGSSKRRIRGSLAPAPTYAMSQNCLINRT